MKGFAKATGLALPAMLIAAGFFCPSATAQAPVVPVIVDTAVPLVVNAVKPKPKANGLVKFEGVVMHANIAQITARAKDSELTILTFPLSQEASQKMRQIVDKGGYQYGDKITVFYNPTTMQAMKFKGKPSKPS
ncbi:MAG: hypothetical protein DMG39_26300 [Acidobacteria bacterium]|nr:MAG: hypothetical protein DMG39_26300 [Acidobacteriota bacterium]